MDDYSRFEIKKAPRGHNDPFEAYHLGTFGKLLLMTSSRRLGVLLGGFL
jgi:hypothetical protein